MVLPGSDYTGQIEVTVIDQANTNPVNNAKVTVNSYRQSAHDGFTGNTGRIIFLQAIDSTGSFRITVEKEGYNTYRNVYTIQRGQKIYAADINLVRAEGGTPPADTGGTDLCAGVICSSPPINACSDSNTLGTYTSTGTCSAGSCNYLFTTTNCQYGCENEQCRAASGGSGTGSVLLITSTLTEGQSLASTGTKAVIGDQEGEFQHAGAREFRKQSDNSQQNMRLLINLNPSENSETYVLENDRMGKTSQEQPTVYNFGPFPAAANKDSYFYKAIAEFNPTITQQDLIGSRLDLFGKTYLVLPTTSFATKIELRHI
ncbi:carboxypeptidase regulatory-like domain-containing protein [Candidatus Woesearchaeota archaeon]|nr:carboxypeptidase regulatory-like domain-containing protein [Candidatus Woesearchaeota archaeon]